VLVPPLPARVLHRLAADLHVCGLRANLLLGLAAARKFLLPHLCGHCGLSGSRRPAELAEGLLCLWQGQDRGRPPQHCPALPTRTVGPGRGEPGVVRGAPRVPAVRSQLSAADPGSAVLGEEIPIPGAGVDDAAVPRAGEDCVHDSGAVLGRAAGGQLRRLHLHRHRPSALSSLVLRTRGEFSLLLAHRQHPLLLEPDRGAVVHAVHLRTGVLYWDSVDAGAGPVRAQPVGNSSYESMQVYAIVVMILFMLLASYVA